MIDTHSHIYLDEFDADRFEVMELARLSGVEAIYMPNIDLTSIEPMLELAQQYPGYCFPMMGLHPTSVKDDFELVLHSILERFDGQSFCAVGEIGIDLYWDKSFRDQQIEAFEQQLRKAKALGLPVVIHCREAFQEVFASVEKYLDSRLTGVFHSFSGSPADVARIAEYGTFMIGINGIATFKNASILPALKVIPPNMLVVETDAPFLAPVPHRGRRNEPAYLVEVVRYLADLYGMDFLEMEAVTTRNAQRLFQKTVV